MQVLWLLQMVAFYAFLTNKTTTHILSFKLNKSTCNQRGAAMTNITFTADDDIIKKARKVAIHRGPDKWRDFQWGEGA